MPSTTFFRLPEEKRLRFLDAARAEFKRVPYGDASINRIITDAHIPRGSFYQYFADKDDLFRYLMGDIREYFLNTLAQILEDTHGDLFAVAPQAFDRLLTPAGQATPHLSHCIEIMQANPGMGPEWLFDPDANSVHDLLRGKLDLTSLRSREPEFVCAAFSLTVMSLARAILDTLRHPEQRDLHRSTLHTHIDIIKHGSIADKEEHHE